MSSVAYGPPTPDSLVGNSTTDISSPNFDYSTLSVSGDDSFALGNQVVPDASGLDLAGQFPGLPGGGASNGGVTTTDSSGINALYLHPAVNPTPTGGYMPTLMAVVASAAQGFSTYAKGSPSVAIPGARTPLGSVRGGALSLTTATGGTNWLLIGGVVVVAVGVLMFIAKKA